MTFSSPLVQLHIVFDPSGQIAHRKQPVLDNSQPPKPQSLIVLLSVFTGLDQVRGMEFGNEAQGGDEFLIAGGVAGTAGVIVLRRTEGGQNMEIVARNLDIPTHTSFVWLCMGVLH
ncbi:hypothetical protein BDZ97DRAFT_2081317 [Flammula alnicola]|nr:hypothetical protein BDZ97DRAFT_2081317 [Flammula alnicola]